MKSIKRFCYSLVMITIVLLTVASTSVYETTFENTSVNNTVNLSTMAMKIIENEENRLYTSLKSLTGDLTGYVYNCPACTGRLACMSSLDLSNGTISYLDADYGEVRIVASSKNLPCGSIVQFDSDRVSDDTTVAIVLDRGVIGNSLDLLVGHIDDAYITVGRSEIDYEVVREGW